MYSATRCHGCSFKQYLSVPIYCVFKSIHEEFSDNFINRPTKTIGITLICILTGVLSQIVRCLDEKRRNLKLFGLTTLNEIAKYNQALARKIVNVPTLPHVINCLTADFTDVEVQV